MRDYLPEFIDIERARDPAAGRAGRRAGRRGGARAWQCRATALRRHGRRVLRSALSGTDPVVRAGMSVSAKLDAATVERAHAPAEDDSRSGEWDARYGEHRDLPEPDPATGCWWPVTIRAGRAPTDADAVLAVWRPRAAPRPARLTTRPPSAARSSTAGRWSPRTRQRRGWSGFWSPPGTAGGEHVPLRRCCALPPLRRDRLGGARGGRRAAPARARGARRITASPGARDPVATGLWRRWLHRRRRHRAVRQNVGLSSRREKGGRCPAAQLLAGGARSHGAPPRLVDARVGSGGVPLPVSRA